MKEIEINAIRKVPEYRFVKISFGRYHSEYDKSPSI